MSIGTAKAETVEACYALVSLRPGCVISDNFERTAPQIDYGKSVQSLDLDTLTSGMLSIYLLDSMLVVQLLRE